MDKHEDYDTRSLSGSMSGKSGDEKGNRRKNDSANDRTSSVCPRKLEDDAEKGDRRKNDSANDRTSSACPQKLEDDAPSVDSASASAVSSISSSGRSNNNSNNLFTSITGTSSRQKSTNRDRSNKESSLSAPEQETTQRNDKKRRKRKRPFFLELSISLSHRKRHPWDEDNDAVAGTDDPHRNAYDTPDFVHFAHLTAALLLCTAMAVVSAFDAKTQCLQHETYAILQLVDDDAAAAAAENFQAAYDAAVLHESDKCIQMFEQVVLPAGAATAVCASTALAILCWYIKKPFSSSPAAAAATATAAESSETDGNNQGSKALQQQQQHAIISPHSSSMIRVTVVLFLLFLTILGLQTYNVTAIMLDPRDTAYSSSSSSSSVGSSSNTDDDYQAAAAGVSGASSSVANPYQSLAAVDRFGQVGANANLYYLAWLCVGLAIALVYQITTACFRVLRAARRQYRHYHRHDNDPADGLLRQLKSTTSSASGNSKNKKLLPATSWDRGGAMMSHQYHSYRNILLDAYDQSRVAWYSSLYRLRMRTGIWTAAFISCLIIIASSQYIWSQVLWPYVSAVVGSNKNNDTTFHYFSVCQMASRKSNGYFAPQLCRRTLAAWLDGLIAAILCATAIVLHLAARYRNHDSTPTSPGSSPNAAHAAEESISGGAPTSHYYEFYDHDVIQLLAAEDACSRTTASAWRSASLTALVNRYYSHSHPKRLSLRTELVLSILLSLLLGFNAVLVTGVQGPASTVGNLYYASWLSFLLCIRICLGCVEEFYNIEHDDHDEEDGGDDGGGNGRPRQYSASSAADSATVDKAAVGEDAGTEQQTKVKTAYEAPEINGIELVPSHSSGIIVSRNSLLDAAPVSVDSTSVATIIEKQEKTRLRRVRGYFFLSNFSAVCAASSFDAAFNQNKALSRPQMYMVVAPCVVAALSTILFALSLSKRCYSTVSRFWIGGLLSILTFEICLVDLILTMHSEDSWAVNKIGEIESANVYYFSWASIIISGVQMTSYIKIVLGIKKPDYMSVVWVAICKVCFVILGAALHIWHTISENCDFDEITLGAVTFCSRTILAITISLVGTLVGGLVVLGRLIVMFCPICKCRRVQAHVEMLISLFLVFLFGAAVAMITGIGGPGQSVGDLYYSTWLAFWVSLGIFVSCFNELNEEEKEMEGPTRSPTGNKRTKDAPAVTVDSVLV